MNAIAKHLGKKLLNVEYEMLQGQGQQGYYQQQAGYPPAQHHPPVNDTAMHAHAPGQQQYYQGGYPPAQGKWD